MMTRKTFSSAGICAVLLLGLLGWSGCSAVGKTLSASSAAGGEDQPAEGQSASLTSGTDSFCTQLELRIEFEETQNSQIDQVPVETKISAVGSLPLTVNATADPITITGVGDLPATGRGKAGDCAFQSSGTVSYRFEGEIFPGEDGDVQLNLRGRRSLNLSTDSNCGVGTTSPFVDLDQKTLQLEEGQTVEWHWGADQSEGNSTWVLHLKCSQ